MDDVRLRLTSCFRTVFPELTEQEVPLASMTSLGSWDSLGTITLLTVIQEEFGIQVPLDDLPLFVSFELILGYLQQQHCHAP